MSELIKTALGKICYTPRGAYDATEPYEVFDVVIHNGSSYLFLKPSKGVEPAGDNIVTMLFAKKGDKGDSFTYADFTAEQIEELQRPAYEAANSAIEVAKHPTFIGEDNYVYKWNHLTKAYDKTDIYVKGEAFNIVATYGSIAEMEADVNNSDVKVGAFVLINTDDVENPDNAKIFVKKKVGDTYVYSFLVDMSGAIGFTGKTPQIFAGITTTSAPGTAMVFSLSPNGVDADGNPKYNLNIAIPRGDTGKPLIVLPNGNYGNWNEETQDYDDSGVEAAATVDIANQVVAFDEATERQNITSGLKFPIIFGLIRKWFSDLKAVAFSGSYNDLSDKPTIPTVPTKIGAFENDKAFQSLSEVTVLVKAHNDSNVSHNDIREKLSDVEAIARGKSRAKVFNTIAELDAWLAVAANVATLQLGDNFYIRAVDVPDYWFDGSGKLPIEGEKVDLTGLLTEDDAALTYAKKMIPKSATLAVASWIDDTANSGFFKQTVIDIDIVNNSNVMHSAASFADLTVGRDAGVENFTTATVGEFVIYAAKKPTVAININYSISF
jgi:hypothetical protein